MPHLELTLFGAPQISLNGSPLTNRIDKTVALIALLAIQGPTLSRDMLITTLWSRSSISKAQAALRTAIWRLKDAGLSPWLEIEREFITLNKHSDLWVDVDEFQMNLDKAKQPPHDQTSACPQCTQWLRRAIELYRGDFMAGYSPRNAPGFDEWRTPLGQRLQDDYLIALARLAKGYQKQGLYGDAVLVANRWLAVDPLNEEAHTLIMRSYVNNNQRANAIAHYRAFKRLADKQLGVDPSREMTQLYQQVLTGHSPPPQSTAPLKEPALMLMDLRHIPDLWARHGAIMEKVVDRFTNGEEVVAMRVVRRVYGPHDVAENGVGQGTGE